VKRRWDEPTRRALDAGPAAIRGDVKYATALYPGTAEAEAILRRFRRSNRQHHIQHGADPDQAPKDGTTPLMIAADFGHALSFALLMEFGAKPARRYRIL
jgi:ankyrin repeat protein